MILEITILISESGGEDISKGRKFPRVILESNNVSGNCSLGIYKVDLRKLLCKGAEAIQSTPLFLMASAGIIPGAFSFSFTVFTEFVFH